MTTGFPLPFTLTRVRRAGKGKDKLGNEVVQETRDEVRVAGWAVPTSDEPKVAGHDRLVVDIEVYAPTGEFLEGDAVDIPKYGRCEVIGHPENYETNPFGWFPGLEVVNLRRADR